MKAFGDIALSVFTFFVIATGIVLIFQKHSIAPMVAIGASIFFALIVPFGIFIARRQVRLRRVHAAGVFREKYGGFFSNQTYFEFLDRKYFENGSPEEAAPPVRGSLRGLIAPGRGEWLIAGAAIPFVLLTALGFLFIFTPFSGISNILYGISADAVPGSVLSGNGRDSFNAVITLGCLAFASSYLYSLRLFVRALISFELSAITALRAFAHMFFAIMLAISIWKIAPSSTAVSAAPGALQAIIASDNKVIGRQSHQEGAPAELAQTVKISKIWLILAFTIGFLPDAAFSWISQRIRLALNRRYLRSAKQMSVTPLTAIDGIDFATAFRLEEGGIGCVQNLAAANPVMLHVETSYCIFLIMDWIAQAQLCTAVGPDRFQLFKKMNIRTIFDLEHAILDHASPLGLKQMAGSILLATSSAKPSLLRDFGVRPLDLANRDFDKAMASWVNIEVIEQLVRVMMESLHIQRFRQLWRDLENSLTPARTERLPRPAPRLAAANGGGRDKHAVEIAPASKSAQQNMQTEIHGE